MNNLTINNCKFILRSHLFDNISDTFWETCQDCMDDCAFGDANRTFISIERMLQYISDTQDYLDSDQYDNDAKILQERLASLDKDVYIDLEN